MKTTEIVILGIAGFFGYKYLTGGQSGTSGGGVLPGGLNLTLPSITIPGGEGLNLSLGGLGGGGGLDLSGILDLFKKAAGSAIPGAGVITDISDIIDKAKKTITEATSQGESAIDKAKKAFEDYIKGLHIPNMPEVVIPNPTEIPDKTKAPDNVTDQTNPIDILEAARGTIKTMGRIGIENYIGAFLTGSHIVRPLPLAKGVQEIGAPIVEKAGIAIGEKLSWRFGEKIGATVGSKVIPGIGWAAMLIDPFADVARLFGLNVPEFLGWSPLLSLGSDTNVLERWVTESEIASNKRKAARVSLVESNTDMTTAHADFPVTFRLSDLEAHTGAPEAPTIGVRETRSAVDIHREIERQKMVNPPGYIPWKVTGGG